MKRTLLPLLLCAAATMAAEPRYGLITQGLLTFSSPPSPYETVMGFGGLAAIDATFDLNETMSIAPYVGFEYSRSGMEASKNGVTAKATMSSMFLPIGANFAFALTPEFRLIVAPEFDVSLGGKGEVEVSSNSSSYSDDGDIKNDKSVLMIGLGASYVLNGTTSLIGGYKIPTGEYIEDYKIGKLYVGGRFDL